MGKISLTLFALIVGLMAIGVASADTVVQSNPVLGEIPAIGIVGAPVPGVIIL